MSRLIRQLFCGLILGGLALPGIRAQPATGADWPLPESYFPALKGLIGAAVSQSPRMVARNAENAVAEGNRIVARSGQLPALNGFVQYFPWQRDERSDLPHPTSTDRLGYNLTLSQPIYHWGALRNNTRMGELQLRMTQGQTAEGYRLLVQEIRGQYLQLVIRKATLAKLHLSLRLVQDNLAAAQVNLEKKVIAPSDIFSPRLALAQTQLATDRAREDYEDHKSILAKLTGTPVLTDPEVPDEIPAPPDAAPALEPLVTAFTGQKEPDSYNLRLLGNQIEVERLTYANLATRLRPQLNFLTGMSQDQQSYTSNIAAKYKVLSYFAGVQLTWSVFDGYATRGAAASSLARRRQLEQSFHDLSGTVVDEARRQFKQLDFARRAMAIADLLLDASAGMRETKRGDAARGLATEADVAAVEISYRDSQINAFMARSDYLLKTGECLSALLQDPALANLPSHP